ncbi:MAG: DUF535 family protein [Novosphingobium sp.]
MRFEPGASLRLRLKFLAKAVAFRREFAPLLAPRAGSSLATLLDARPDMLGIVLWPYVATSWTVPQRIARLVGHCEILDSLGPPLRRHPDDAVRVLDLGHVHPGVTLVLDQPRWFEREGQLVLNLFLDDERMFSLAFDFGQGPLGLAAVVGAVQGRDLPHAQDFYRALTKSFFGLRPRDLLFELFRGFCRALEVRTIVAVSDAFRHHRGAYFRGTKTADLTLDYDQVWSERGGTRADDGFFQLAVAMPQRDKVPSRKRAMYRRRYDFLHASEAAMRQWLRPDRAGEGG